MVIYCRRNPVPSQAELGESGEKLDESGEVSFGTEECQDCRLEFFARKVSLMQGVNAPIPVMVIDDDPVVRTVLKSYIGRHASLRWIGEARSAADAAAQFHDGLQPDVMFLDVVMPRATGFDLLCGLEKAPKVVFVTSSSQHAVQAFECEAIDYLLKPVTQERFADTVHRLERFFYQDEKNGGDASAKDTGSISLRNGRQNIIMPLARIAALLAEGDFTRVLSVEREPLMICRTLGDFEQALPAPPFHRLDRSTIINRDRMLRLDRISRDLSHLWLRGLALPLNMGRTAMERLRRMPGVFVP